MISYMPHRADCLWPLIANAVLTDLECLCAAREAREGREEIDHG